MAVIHGNINQHCCESGREMIEDVKMHDYIKETKPYKNVLNNKVSYNTGILFFIVIL